MISTAAVLIGLALSAHPNLPDDANWKTHPLLNAAGVYRVESLDGNLTLVRKSDEPGNPAVPVEPLRLHRSFLILLALLIALYRFGRKNFLRVVSTWAWTLPIAAFLFTAAASDFAKASFHIYSPLLAALAGGLGMKTILGDDHRKATAASIGVAMALPITYAILWFCLTISKITGFALESINVLDYLLRQTSGTDFKPLPDYDRIVLLSMLFGALGAMCDMSADVTSGSVEVSRQTGASSNQGTLRISDHAVGSMTNTLILAYFGGNLMLFLSWIALPEPAQIFWNRESTALELIRAVGGSFGFLLTAMVCVSILKINRNN